MPSMVRHVSIDDVRTARERLEGRVRRTWLEESVYLGNRNRRYFISWKANKLVSLLKFVALLMF